MYVPASFNESVDIRTSLNKNSFPRQALKTGREWNRHKTSEGLIYG